MGAVVVVNVKRASKTEVSRVTADDLGCDAGPPRCRSGCRCRRCWTCRSRVLLLCCRRLRRPSLSLSPPPLTVLVPVMPCALLGHALVMAARTGIILLKFKETQREGKATGALCQERQKRVHCPTEAYGHATITTVPWPAHNSGSGRLFCSRSQNCTDIKREEDGRSSHCSQ